MQMLTLTAFNACISRLSKLQVQRSTQSADCDVLMASRYENLLKLINFEFAVDFTVRLRIIFSTIGDRSEIAIATGDGVAIVKW